MKWSIDKNTNGAKWYIGADKPTYQTIYWRRWYQMIHRRNWSFAFGDIIATNDSLAIIAPMDNLVIQWRQMIHWWQWSMHHLAIPRDKWSIGDNGANRSFDVPMTLMDHLTIQWRNWIAKWFTHSEIWMAVLKGVSPSNGSSYGDRLEPLTGSPSDHMTIHLIHSNDPLPPIHRTLLPINYLIET